MTPTEAEKLDSNIDPYYILQHAIREAFALAVSLEGQRGVPYAGHPTDAIFDQSYNELLAKLQAYIAERERLARIDELLGADDEVRLHNVIGSSYQEWFTKRLAQLQQKGDK